MKKILIILMLLFAFTLSSCDLFNSEQEKEYTSEFEEIN